MKKFVQLFLMVAMMAVFASPAFAAPSEGAYYPTSYYPNADGNLWTVDSIYNNVTDVLSIDTTENKGELGTLELFRIDTTGESDTTAKYWVTRPIDVDDANEIVEINALVCVNGEVDGYGSAPNSSGTAIWLETSKYGETLFIKHDRIKAYRANQVYFLTDPQNACHSYRLVADDGKLKVYVDDIADPVITVLTMPAVKTRSLVGFGDGSGSYNGDQSWAYFEYSVTTAAP